MPESNYESLIRIVQRIVRVLENLIRVIDNQKWESTGKKVCHYDASKYYYLIEHLNDTGRSLCAPF